MKRKVVRALMIFAGILVVGWTFWVVIFVKPWEKKKLDFDYVIEVLPPETVVELLHAGKVKRVSYPKMPKVPLPEVHITLKTGTIFVSGPMRPIRSAIEQCGEPCRDIELIAY